MIDYLSPGSAYISYLDDWTSGITAGHIQSMGLYSDTPQRTRLLLGNSAWLERTLATNSENIQLFDGLFEKNSGEQYWVPMTRRQGIYNSYYDDTVAAVELPLGSSRKSMVIFMPSAGNFDSFSEKLKERIPLILSLLTPQNVNIVLPAFNINSLNNMSEFMRSVGVYKAFDEKTADFSGINGLGYCYLKDLSEHATVGVGKESLYAGSVAVAVIEATPNEPKDLWSVGSSYSDFTIEIGCPMIYQKAGNPDARSFVFIIRDVGTKAILYIGRLMDAGGTDAGKWVCSWPIMM